MMNDIEPFRRMWSQIVAHLEEQRLAEEERLALENADPMDPAVQARIAEEIRLKNVQGQTLSERCKEIAGRHKVCFCIGL